MRRVNKKKISSLPFFSIGFVKDKSQFESLCCRQSGQRSVERVCQRRYNPYKTLTGEISEGKYFLRIKNTPLGRSTEV